MSVQLTAAQARALVELAEREGRLTLHQLAVSDPGSEALDLYAVSHTREGYRITADGTTAPVGEMLPADGTASPGPPSA